MPRFTITITPANREWINKQVQRGHYTTRSELINDLIRRAKENETKKRKR